MSAELAYKHCQRSWDSRGPWHCEFCNTAHPRAHLARQCCMQHGLQRRPGFKWRGYQTLEQQYQERMEAIRRDPEQMREIAAMVDLMLERMPPPRES